MKVTAANIGLTVWNVKRRTCWNFIFDNETQLRTWDSEQSLNNGEHQKICPFSSNVDLVIDTLPIRTQVIILVIFCSDQPPQVQADGHRLTEDFCVFVCVSISRNVLLIFNVMQNKYTLFLGVSQIQLNPVKATQGALVGQRVVLCYCSYLHDSRYSTQRLHNNSRIMSTIILLLLLLLLLLLIVGIYQQSFRHQLKVLIFIKSVSTAWAKDFYMNIRCLCLAVTFSGVAVHH